MAAPFSRARRPFLPCEGLLCPPEGRIRADCGPGNGQNRGSAGDCGDHRGIAN